MHDALLEYFLKLFARRTIVKISWISPEAFGRLPVYVLLRSSSSRARGSYLSLLQPHCQRQAKGFHYQLCYLMLPSVPWRISQHHVLYLLLLGHTTNTLN